MVNLFTIECTSITVSYNQYYFIFVLRMDRLEDNPAPLTDDEIFRLKTDIRDDINILSYFSPGNEKSMIIHFIVEGPHANLELAEWMINMGVLKFETINEMNCPQWSPNSYGAVAFAGNFTILLI